MLEILYNENGEIIVVKKSPAIWGTAETNIILFDNALLEEYMGDHSQIVLPYKTIKKIIYSKKLAGQKCPFFACNGIIGENGACNVCNWENSIWETDKKSKYKVDLANLKEIITFEDLLENGDDQNN